MASHESVGTIGARYHLSGGFPNVMNVIDSAGRTCQARDARSGRSVTIRQVSCDESEMGVPVQVLREVHILKSLDASHVDGNSWDLEPHPNFLKLLDIVIQDATRYFFIFEHLDDLHSLLEMYREKEQKMPMGLVRKYAKGLLNGLIACHACQFLHRDVKPCNIFIDGETLKIGGFGCACAIPVGSGSKQCPDVAPLPASIPNTDASASWCYRAPELLMGVRSHGKEVDIWSAGCIIAEMAIARVVFEGESAVQVLTKVFQALGPPVQESGFHVENFVRLPLMYTFTFQGSGLGCLLDLRPELEPAGLDLLEKLLSLSPRARISARRGNYHAFFMQDLP